MRQCLVALKIGGQYCRAARSPIFFIVGLAHPVILCYHKSMRRKYTRKEPATPSYEPSEMSIEEALELARAAGLLVIPPEKRERLIKIRDSLARHKTQDIGAWTLTGVYPSKGITMDTLVRYGVFGPRLSEMDL